MTKIEKFTNEHIGKTITIRQWDDMVSEFGMYREDIFNEEIIFSKYMKILCGQRFTIECIDKMGGWVLIERYAVFPWMTEEYCGKDPTIINAKKAEGHLTSMNNDQVNHPSHYTSGKTEVIDAIEDWGLGFHLGNVVKYVARAGKKNPDKVIEDLKKARWYLDRKINSLLTSVRGSDNGN